MIPAIISRLKAEVPDLRRVDATRALEEERRKGALRVQSPAAFVVPLGVQGQTPQAVSRYFVQPLRETIGVILIIQTDTPAGAQALDRLDAFIREVTLAIVGWTPDPETPGVFQLGRGANVPADPGTVIYQLDFSILDQVRVPS